jgi:LCP family protein required for cell wall assembly
VPDHSGATGHPGLPPERPGIPAEHLALPPELDPRGRRRPIKSGKPVKTARSTRRGGWRSPLGITAAVLSVCVLATSGLLYTRYLHYDHNLTRAAGVIKPGGVAATDGAENVLLVGSDSRTGAGDQFAQAPKGQTAVEGARSDTVILAHLAKGHQAATLVSLPRDSWVTIPAYTDAKGVVHPAHMDKLNAAFSLGGAALLVSTVQQLTEIHIDHYVEIDFAGFQSMVDSLGGVDVCLSKPAHDVQTGLNLSAGVHHLDGKTALAFVRQRYGLPLGDIDRIKRQQQFLASMVRKVESAGTLTNPLKLNDFLDALTKSISVDSGMSATDLAKLALKLKGLGTGNIVLTTMPLSGFSTQNGVDVDDIDVPKATALFSSLAIDAPVAATTSAAAPAPPAAPLTVPASAVHVQVFNGGGVTGLARRAASDLTKLGFQLVGTPADRINHASGTVIAYGPTQAEAARTLQAAIPGSTLQANPQLDTTLELLVGSSYAGAHAPGASANPSASATSPANADTTGGTTAANASCTA